MTWGDFLAGVLACLAGLLLVAALVLTWLTYGRGRR